jgi:hypothetical protein
MEDTEIVSGDELSEVASDALAEVIALARQKRAMICEHCGTDATKVGIVIHGTELWCRPCHEITKLGVNEAHGVVGDEIDVTIRHGMCWPDGTPRRWRSRKELNEAAAAAGMVNMVRTRTTPGPNPHRKVFGMRGHTKGSTQT